MPRPRLALGTWGKITRTETQPKRWRARARFRDFTGKTRQVEAWGRSGAEAERNLTTTLRAMTRAGGTTITGNTTTVATLGNLWIAGLEATDKTQQTVQRYKRTVEKHITPALGDLLLIEATVSRIDGFLRTLAEQKPGTAKMCKVCLAGMFALAVRHDALQTSPVKEVRLPTRKRKPVSALTVDDVRALRRGLHEWQTQEHVKGPDRGTTTLDVVDVMLGTGMRIGEVLALRWDDVDLGEHPTVTVSGTLVYRQGEGNVRQGHAKTESGYRTLTLPAFVVDVLLRRSVEATPTETNAVFPSGAGTWLWPNNYRRTLRAALESMGETGRLSPHVFRKSVATLVDAEATLEAASALLGHSGSAVTSAYYVAKAAQAPDMSAILEQFGRDANEKDG